MHAGAAGETAAGGTAAGGSNAGAAGGRGDAAAYPDSIRCLPGDADPRCGPGFDPDAPMDQATLDAALSAGLSAWTDPSSEGGACVNCHSPDAIDLAWIGYSDCDIERRALDHVAPDQAAAIVELVHAQRQIHAIAKPLHPDRYRPLQPGYEPFGDPRDDLEVADTDLQDQRDLAFMRYLTDELKLTWATRRIDTLELAQAAYAELRDLDLASLRLGIPFDRFSEDPEAGANACWSTPGPAHRGKSIFEWVPAMPTQAKPGREAEWNAALERYRKDPSTDNLWGYYDAIDEETDCGYDLGANGDPEYFRRACDWMRLKYKSLQLLQHMLRVGSTSHPDPLSDLRKGGQQPMIVDHLPLVIARRPIWETADVIRVAPLERRGDPACFSSPNHPCTFLPVKIDETVHSVPSHREALISQGDLFQVSWFMMSFLQDPTLTQHSESFATFIGDYLESVLLPRYDIHHAFVVALMAVRKSAAKEFLDYPGFREGTGKIASVRTFSFKQLRDNFSPPADEARREVHSRMFANFARMFIFLIEDDLERSHEIYGRDGVAGGGPTSAGGLLSAVRFLREWIGELEGQEDAELNQRAAHIEALATSARELRSAANYAEYPGLQPSDRWAEYQTPYATP